MGKKESAQKQLFSELKPPSRGKLKEFLLTFLKFLMGVCLLPIVYAVSICFGGQLVKLDTQIIKSFLFGGTSFLGLYLFVWEPEILFKKGQKILELTFRFFAPLVKVAPYLLPIYSILIFILYFILVVFMDTRSLTSAFVFFIGFSFALHIVFCAKTLRFKKEDALKAGYIFGFSLIYILDTLLLAFFFNIIFVEFSFLKLFNESYQIAKSIYLAVFSQLFL